MSPRLRYLVLALLGGWCGAAIELIDVASLRPWSGAAFRRAALEVGGLWTAAVLGLALLLFLIPKRRRELAPAGALLLAPLAWSIAWLLGKFDPRAQMETYALALAGVMLLVCGLVLQRVGERLLARVPLIARPLPWIGLLALFSAVAIWKWKSTTPQLAPMTFSGMQKTPPNVLWISVDTLRADRLGAYGSTRGLTPNLDRLAAEGVVFADATCPMPLTAPSHAAMLTGLMPHESGVHKNGVPLPRATNSLPRLLGREGYATAAFVSGFPLFERSSHLASQFHHYDDEFDPHAPLCEGTRLTPFGRILLRALRKRIKWREPIERFGDVTVDRAIEWLDDDARGAGGAGARPYFVFLHLYDVHAEYVPHDGDRPSRFWDVDSSLERLRILDDEAQRKRIVELYDGEVKFADAQVGRLLDHLRKNGSLDQTLVVFTADHGESLGEHDFWYEHVNPYHVETHVPLLLRLPGAAHQGTRVAGPAQLTDLIATVRDLVGSSAELPETNVSLVSAIASGTIPRRLIFCQSMFGFDNAWFETSVRDGRFKLLRIATAFERADSRRVPGRELLFDLVADPGETIDLLARGAAPDEARIDVLRAALDVYELACISVGPDHVDPEVEANLARLGYTR